MSWWEWVIAALGAAVYLLWGAALVAGTFAAVDVARLPEAVKIDEARARLAALKVVGAAFWPAFVLVALVLVTAQSLARFIRWLDHDTEKTAA